MTSSLSLAVPLPRSRSCKSGYTILSSHLELSISCSGLVTSNSSKPNSEVVVYNLLEPGTQKWSEYFRTEKVDKSDSPNFAKKMYLEHFFEASAESLKFVVYNIDPKISDVSNQKILGEAISTVGDIANPSHQQTVLELKNGSEAKGKINIHAEVPDECKDVVHMSWEWTKSRITIGMKPLLKLEFSRCNEDNSYSVCLRSDSNKHAWKNLNIPVQALCNSNDDRPIKIQVFEARNNKKESALVGEFTTNFGKLREGPSEKNVYDCKVKKNGKEEKVGDLRLVDLQTEKFHTFHDYIKAGMEMSFVVAIDFTSSNKNPSEPNSLHHIDPSHPNEYEMAIQGVGYVLQKYDSDMKFPCFGFGAKVPPENKLSNKFPINLTADPNCIGVEGVLQAYRNCVKKVEFGGPTIFAPVIHHVSEEARRVVGASNYYVLLLITDGVYSDRESTIEAIIEAAKLPMSIIIVGVGDENFKDMEELDSDDVLLSCGNDKAERDIVQFVPFRDYITGDKSKIVNRGRFKSEVLKEIPDQIMQYMRKQKLAPGRGV